MQIIVALLLVLLAAPLSFAAEFPSFFEGVRPLGMGGAFTAVADDENALFYNPAGLNKVENWSMGLINPIVEVSDAGIDFQKDLSDTDTETTSEVIDLLKDYMGENMHFRAAIFPHVVKKNFAFGVLGQSKVNMKVDNPQFPETRIQAFTSGSGHLGIGSGWLDDKLRLGVGIKFVQAYHLDQVYTATDISDPDFDQRVEDDLLDGSGLGFDLGAIYTFPVRFSPAIGVTVQNLSDLDLGDAGEIPQQVNLGFAATESFGQDKWLKLTGAADWMDVTEAYDTEDDLYKRLHLGLEASMKPTLWFLPHQLALRTGLYQGYGSVGATLDFHLLKLDYANYASEIGSYAGVKPDRRHVVQLTIGW